MDGDASIMLTSEKQASSGARKSPNRRKHAQKHSRNHVHSRDFLSNCMTLGAFFWDYSGIGILGIVGICVLSRVIPFSE